MNGVQRYMKDERAVFRRGYEDGLAGRHSQPPDEWEAYTYERGWQFGSLEAQRRARRARGEDW